MKKRMCWILVTLIIPFYLSAAFGEYEPATQNGLPEGVKMRLGKGAISKIAYSPDGTRLAVGSSIGVWIYDIETGKALDLFPMYGVSCLAFSPGGKTVVSGSRQHHLVLWDIATGEPLRTFISGFQDEVFSVAFSPDGKTIVSGHDNGLICLLETATGKASHYFFNIWGEASSLLVPHHVGAIRGLAYSPDGKTLVSICKGNGGDAIHLWDATMGRYIQLIEYVAGEMDSVESIAFSPNGQTLAVGMGTGGISLWDTKTYEFIQNLGHHKWEVLSLAFSPDGNLLASCGKDNTVGLSDVKTKKLLRAFIGHKSGFSNEISCVAFSPDGKTVASSSKESVRFWNTQGEEHLRSVIAHTAILDVTFSPDGKTLTTGNGDNTVSLLEAKTGKHMSTFTGHKDEVSKVVFNLDGKTLASIGKDTVRLWDTKTGEHQRALPESKYVDVTFSPDRETFATETQGSTVRLWNTKTSELRHTFNKQNHWVIRMEFSQDGQLLALLQDKDRNRSLWDIKTDKLICSFTVPITMINLWGAAFSPDGKILATGMRDKTPLGKRDEIVWLWDTTTGEHIRTLTGHLSIITSVVFSPDGQLLASGSKDETVLLWDLKTGQHPRILLGHNDEVLGVTFSPDGNILASRCKDGTVLLWDLDEVLTDGNKGK